MYKYYMTIDGDTYMALFLNIDEANNFIEELERDEGVKVCVHGVESISNIWSIIEDTDFEQSYIDEMACIYLLGQAECKKRFSKVHQMHEYLQIKGYLD